MAQILDRVEVAGLNIAYQRQGVGPPLVLLHGAYGDSRLWRRQIEGLSDEYMVIAWDAPGCGQSDDPPDGFAASDYADCLAGLIEALGLTAPCVLGLSWGSVLALGFYQHHPDAVGSLVLASAYAGWAGSLPAEEVQRRLRQVLREVRQPPEEFVPRWIPTLLTSAAPPELVSEVSGIMADFHRVGMRAAANSLGEADYRDMLPTIAVPTLLLYGEEDVRSPVSPVGENLHAQIPGSTMVVLPGAPHLSNVEAPQQFNAAVRHWLRGIRA